MRNTKKIQVRGNYKLATEFMKTKQVYTKQDIIEFYMRKLKLDYNAAKYSAIILLSPRKESRRGDCRGSTSNPWGHLAYNDKLPRKVIDVVTGKKEKQRYRFRYRDVALEPRLYPYQVRKVEQEKIAVKKPRKVKTNITEQVQA